MINVFIHVSHENGIENFHHSVKYVPHSGDRFSLSVDTTVYEVDYTLFNLFSCDYEIEIYCHEIN